MEYFNLDLDYIKNNILDVYVEKTFKFSDKIGTAFFHSETFNNFKSEYKKQLLENKSVKLHIDFFSNIILDFQTNISNLLNNKILFNFDNENEIYFNNFFVYRRHLSDINFIYEKKSILENLNLQISIKPELRRQETNYILSRYIMITNNNSDEESIEILTSFLSKTLGYINGNLHTNVDNAFNLLNFLNKTIFDIKKHGFYIDSLIEPNKEYFVLDLINKLEESKDIIKLNTDFDISENLFIMKEKYKKNDKLIVKI